LITPPNHAGILSSRIDRINFQFDRRKLHGGEVGNNQGCLSLIIENVDLVIRLKWLGEIERRGLISSVTGRCLDRGVNHRHDKADGHNEKEFFHKAKVVGAELKCKLFVLNLSDHPVNPLSQSKGAVNNPGDPFAGYASFGHDFLDELGFPSFVQ